MAKRKRKSKGGRPTGGEGVLPAAGDKVQWQCMMGPMDRAALAFIKERHMHRAAGESLRYAVREQASPAMVVLPAVALGIKESVNLLAYRSRMEGAGEAGAERKQKAFSLWLGREDLERMDAIRGRWDLGSRGHAARFAVRAQAIREGYKPPGGKW